MLVFELKTIQINVKFEADKLVGACVLTLRSLNFGIFQFFFSNSISYLTVNTLRTDYKNQLVNFEVLHPVLLVQ